MPARLTFITGSKAGQHYDLETEEITIGRLPDMTVQFHSGESVVSGRHATIFCREGKYFIRDEESRNGTFVNRKRVAERQLRSGDVIEFGPGGPSAQYSTTTTLEIIPTLDAGEPMKTVDLYRLARSRTSELGTGKFRRPFTVTGEFIALAHRRSAKAAKFMFLGAIVILLAASVLMVSNLRTRANLQNALSQLSAELQRERGTGVALARNLAAAQTTLQTQYDSLQSLFDLRRQEVARDASFGEDVTNNFMRGVALLIYTYAFAEGKTGRLLRYRVDGEGKVVMIPGPAGREVPALSFNASGPPVERFGTATGFLIDSDGWILTNRHVAEPWRSDAQMRQMVEAGVAVRPMFTVLRAYFPPGNNSYPLVVERLSDEQDVALMRSLLRPDQIPVLPLADPSAVAQPGQQVVFIGYPTGIHNLMFRVSREERADIVATVGEDSPPTQLVEELARRQLIQPLVVSGSVSDTTGTEVIHTAETTGGGSGGPIIGPGLKVLAIHYAYVQSPIQGDPFRTQRSVKVKFAWNLLPEIVRSRLSTSD